MDSGLAGTRSQACAGCVNLPALPAPRNDESEFTRVGLRPQRRLGHTLGPVRRVLHCDHYATVLPGKRMQAREVGAQCLRNWIDRAVHRHPDKLCMVSGENGRAMTLGELRSLTGGIAGYLRGR